MNAQLETVTRGPFFVIGAAWFVLVAAFCAKIYDTGLVVVAVKWALVLCGLCLLDLFAMAKSIWAAMSWMSAADGSPARTAWGMQTFFWGVMKLACLGVLVFALIVGRSAIPHAALLCGLATLIVVPMAGGFWWSAKELKKELGHA